MADARSEGRVSLEITTKSIEQTLVPLVTQITTLVNYKEKPRSSDRFTRAMGRVGQAVNLAVERFTTVGEHIADENPNIKREMCEACHEARQAGSSIQQLTDSQSEPSSPLSASDKSFTEKTSMIRAARQLLSAITRVLLLADKVVVKTILTARDRVIKSLTVLESVSSFPDFVKTFSQFGDQMVTLAHLTGDRQNALLRHPECESARQNRDAVFQQMHRALQMIQEIVVDGQTSGSVQYSASMANGDSGIALAQQPITAHKALRELDDLVAMTRVTMVGDNMQDKLTTALDNVTESTQDFTDSAYTSHSHREKILELCENARLELEILLRIGLNLDQLDASPSGDLETAIVKTTSTTKSLRKLLQDTAFEQASEMFSSNEDRELLTSLKNHGASGHSEVIEELAVKFEEHSEQLQELCKLLRHVAGTKALQINAEFMENNLKYLGPQVIFAIQSLASHLNSKVTKENVDKFCEAWQTSVTDLSSLSKEVSDFSMGSRSERHVYMSLPRPGKHGTTLRGLKGVRLDAEEQAKIAKLGLEVKLITSEMDAKTEKWDAPNTELIQRARNMSSMAFNMYLFTRGEGPLRTTQDLFTQAEYFADEGNKLYKSVRGDFLLKVPAGVHKQELLSHLERLPVYCQQLHNTIKAPTIGKAATFNKVDGAIQETKNLMNAVSKVVTTCLTCSTKYNIEHASHAQPSGHQWPQSSLIEPRSNGGSDSESVKSANSEGAVLKSSAFGRHFSSNLS